MVTALSKGGAMYLAESSGSFKNGSSVGNSNSATHGPNIDCK